MQYIGSNDFSFAAQLKQLKWVQKPTQIL